MKMIATNKLSDKLKDISVEMPNAPYSNRCRQGVKNDTANGYK